jgi:Cof subfamily protein (haloacid dehalogenase superfamily)
MMSRAASRSTSDHGAYWIVYVDLDGTLLTSELTVTDRTRATLKSAELFAHIVLTSGRPASSCLKAASDLLNSPSVVIASNGGAVVDCRSGRVLAATTFQDGAAAAVADLARAAGLALCVYHPLNWYANESDSRMLQEVSRSRSVPTWVPTVEDYLYSAVKLLLIGRPEALRELGPAIERLNAVTAFSTYPEYLEVMPVNSDKAAAALVVRDYLDGQCGRRTIAIGDGPGDLPLFRFADESVAVANASAVVQRAATYIAPTNDNDGAAIAIEAIVLGNPASMLSLSKPQSTAGSL